MYILYMDESGTEERGVPPNHFVLLGLAIKGDLWKVQDDLIESVKKPYDLSGVEIHTAWMARRYVEQERIPDFPRLDRPERRARAEREVLRRAGVLAVSGNPQKVKNYRKEVNKIRPYLHLAHEERARCLLELANRISTQERTIATARYASIMGGGRRLIAHRRDSATRR